jgi:hypothetical protein
MNPHIKKSDLLDFVKMNEELQDINNLFVSAQNVIRINNDRKTTCNRGCMTTIETLANQILQKVNESAGLSAWIGFLASMEHIDMISLLFKFRLASILIAVDGKTAATALNINHVLELQLGENGLYTVVPIKKTLLRREDQPRPQETRERRPQESRPQETRERYPQETRERYPQETRERRPQEFRDTRERYPQESRPQEPRDTRERRPQETHPQESRTQEVDEDGFNKVQRKRNTKNRGRKNEPVMSADACEQILKDLTSPEPRHTPYLNALTMSPKSWAVEDNDDLDDYTVPQKVSSPTTEVIKPTAIKPAAAKPAAVTKPATKPATKPTAAKPAAADTAADATPTTIIDNEKVEASADNVAVDTSTTVDQE